MAVWLVRAGSRGEHQQKFIDDGRVYVTWHDFVVDIGALGKPDDLMRELAQFHPTKTVKQLTSWRAQLWPFAHSMKKGDTVVLPLKPERALLFGEIIGDYRFDPKGPNPYFHYRAVKWMPDPVPRSAFPQDLLNTLGAFLTICRVHSNDAERRLAEASKNGWKFPDHTPDALPTDDSAEVMDDVLKDLEDAADDQIADLISTTFKGHNLTRLVDAILRAQGYTTYQSPAGPDGGVDILASSGPLGFSSPRICVEVKSGKDTVDRPTVDKLLGAMSKFNAEQGLFVSWSGFKQNVQKELASSFFRLRLWGPKEFLDALFENYEKFDAELKAELPLKRIWTVSSLDDSE